MAEKPTARARIQTVVWHARHPLHKHGRAQRKHTTSASPSSIVHETHRRNDGDWQLEHKHEMMVHANDWQARPARRIEAGLPPSLPEETVKDEDRTMEGGDRRHARAGCWLQHGAGALRGGHGGGGATGASCTAGLRVPDVAGGVAVQHAAPQAAPDRRGTNHR